MKRVMRGLAHGLLGMIICGAIAFNCLTADLPSPDDLLTRATTAGAFRVLPLQSYTMYDLEVMGQTGTMVMIIKKKRGNVS